MYGDVKYSHTAVIDHYRHIQSTGVSLIRDSHRNASTKVPVNSTKLGVGFVCNTNNTNTCQDITEYSCIGDVHTLYAIVAHRGLERYNTGYDCEWGLYDLDFLQCDDAQLPLDYQLLYVHPSKNGKISGFHYLTVVENTGRLLYCSKPPNGALSVWHRTQMYCTVYTVLTNRYVDNVDRAEAKLAYNNFLDDQHSWHNYGCSYEKYVLHIIDRLIEGCCEPVPQEGGLVTRQSNESCCTEYNSHTNTSHTNHCQNQSSIPNGIEAHLGPQVRKNAILRDASLSTKNIGFLNHCPKNFTFIGPDRAPQNINLLDDYLRIASTIRATGVPNYACARIPLISGLNIAEWERELRDYHDPLLLQYLKFGFPLSLVHPQDLFNTAITNHHSANQFPEAIQKYLQEECSLGAMLGPLDQVNSEHFHCSPLLTRPKDKNKRRVILNLSHPYGRSVNDHVDKNHFDGHEFTLRFPTIDDIVEEILKVKNDPVLYKIDVVRAFRNLKVDPVDALKFGIQWDGLYFLDQCVAFGCTHGSAAFQMVSDAVTFIMQKHGAKIFAYIDDYIGISEASDAMRHFNDLHALLIRLGLPINQQKLSPPSKTLTCLGVHIDTPKASLSIDQDKLTSIHKECFHIVDKKYLSRKNFQSLLGKLIYLHKCVVPARIFINRIWKPHIPESQALYLDACLSGMGAIWHNRVYSTPVPAIPGFDLKILHLEMMNIIVALRLWGRLWQHSQVKIFCDNEAVVQVVASSRTKDPFWGACIRNLWLIIAVFDISFQIEHIRGRHNIKVDLLSRLYSDKPVHQDLLLDLKLNYIWDKVLPQHFNLDLNI